LLKVGLTGGLASGKSTVGTMFAERGAQVVDADKIARDLMRPGKPVYYEVVRHFGPEIVDIDGSIDRAKLASIVFPVRIEELNRIVHPAVIRAQEQWMEEQGRRDPHAVVIVEAALIVEAGVGKRFDKLVVVTCDMERKVARFAARLHMDEAAVRAEVERRLAAQVPDEAKVKVADFVIDNCGPVEDLGPQVDKVWNELKRLAEKQ
jgi:dephospho-CoA kinase